MTDGTGHGPSRRITQRANRIAFNFLGNIDQQVDVSHMAMTMFNAMQILSPSSQFLHDKDCIDHKIRDDRSA